MLYLTAGVQDEYSVNNEEIVGNDDEEIGGMFKKVSKAQHILQSRKDNMNLTESSLMFPWNTATKDWTTEEVFSIFTQYPDEITKVFYIFRIRD